MISRPIMRWHGGKFRLAPWLLGFLPPHDCYVEPYGGAASLLLVKPRARIECYNDIDGAATAVFRALRDSAQAQELQRRLALTAFARHELEWAHEPASDPLDAAHRLIVRSFLGHGSDAATRNCRAGFRNSFIGNAAMDWAGYPDQVPAFAHRLSGVIIENEPALQMIARMDSPDTLFYLDPPRLSDPEDQRSHGARHPMTDEDLRELAIVLRQIDGMALISGSIDEPFAHDLVTGWQRFDLQQRLEGGGRRTESVWLNPACSQALNAGPRPGRPLFAEVA